MTIYQKEMVKYRTLNEQNEKELRVVQQAMVKVKDEKMAVESEMKSLKEYSRKLESRLISEVNKNEGNNNGTQNNTSTNATAGGPLQEII